jgi:hypothetical protein
MASPKVTSLSARDRDIMFILMRWHLNRRRAMCPWPLEADGTNQLFVPPDIWSTLCRMRSMGVIPNEQARSRTQAVEVRPTLTLHIEMTGARCLMNPPEHISLLVTGTPQYEEFMNWLAFAEPLERDRRLVCVAWKGLLNTAKTWLQVWKAFPEAFEILVGASSVFQPDTLRERGIYIDTRHSHIVLNKLRRFWSEMQGLDPEYCRASAMPSSVHDRCVIARPVAARACTQAAMLPASTGDLDDTIWRRTWLTIKKEDPTNV